MAVKRSAQEAFGKENAQLSAFAAARLGKTKTLSAVNGHEELNVGDNAVHRGDTYLDQITDLTPTPIREDVLSEPGRFANSRPTIQPLQFSRIGAELRDDAAIESTSSAYALRSGDSILAVGEYDIEVADGAVSLYGAALRKDSGRHRVYAPSTHALPRIVSRAPNTEIRIHTVNSQVRKLEALSPLFRNIWVQNAEGKSYSVLFSASSDELQRSLYALEELSDSQKLLSQLCSRAESEHGRLSLICAGPKSAGKSTLCRTICNAFLTRSPAKRCLYLDLDPGQPEFGPPGQVYLIEVLAPVFGPSYTHFASSNSSRNRLICAHTLAATSFKDDPQHYLACIRTLFRHEHVRQARRDGGCPLIINSCGWTNALGARVLEDIMDMGVTDSVVIDMPDKALVHMIRSKSQMCYEISRSTTRPTVRTSAELRQMHTLAYFHSRTSRNMVHNVVAKPISQWRPWIVSYDGPNAGIDAIVSYGQLFNPAFLIEVLDGTLVGIVTTSDSTYADVTENSSHQLSARTFRTAEGLPHIQATDALDPQLHEYHGLALVRSIDTEAKTLHLITPLSESQMVALMEQTVLLVRGAFDNPGWAYLEAVHAGARSQLSVPLPWVSRQEMVGIEGSVWRLRHPPTVQQVNGRK